MQPEQTIKNLVAENEYLLSQITELNNWLTQLKEQQNNDKMQTYSEGYMASTLANNIIEIEKLQQNLANTTQIKDIVEQANQQLEIDMLASYKAQQGYKATIKTLTAAHLHSSLIIAELEQATSLIKQLKGIQKENAELKSTVASLTFENELLQAQMQEKNQLLTYYSHKKLKEI